MKKGLNLVLKINLIIILSTIISSCSNKHDDHSLDNIWKLAYKGYNYGYDLPKSETASTADMSYNVIKCTKLVTVMEQYYCILGVAFKATNKSKANKKSIKEMSIDGVAEFANEQLHYIGHAGYGKYKK